MTTQELIDQMSALQTRHSAPLLVTVDVSQNVVQLVAYQNTAAGTKGTGDWCLDIRTNLYTANFGNGRETELAQETVLEVIGALREITAKHSYTLAKLKIACETNDIPALIAGVRSLTGLDDSDVPEN